MVGDVNRISLVSKPIQISPADMVASASKSLSMGAVRMPLVLCVRRCGSPPLSDSVYSSAAVGADWQVYIICLYTLGSDILDSAV